ncbi:MAG: tRNA-dihydrouridine synthase family protein [Clostridia bacterium]|nr:tRNA-dihydrouridine synthase family protein [Clostridia bacterium]
MIKSVNIGGYITANNLFIAPLAGFTDHAFRQVCLSLGAGLVYTEMVSAKALIHDNERTKELLIGANDKTVAQIFGNEPETLKLACLHQDIAPYKLVDINMGCPAPKIYGNKEGSYLLNDFNLAGKIIYECAKTDKIITVKTRLGITDENPLILDFAKLCEDNGAKLITIHARSKEAVYSGECNYGLVEKVKGKINIPVIVNGGIFTKEDGLKAYKDSGADGIMLARGVLENPTLICDFLNTKAPSVKSLLFRQLQILQDTFLKEEYVCVRMRKAIAYYLKRVRGSKEAKIKIFNAKTIKEIKEILSPLDF